MEILFQQWESWKEKGRKNENIKEMDYSIKVSVLYLMHLKEIKNWKNGTRNLKSNTF